MDMDAVTSYHRNISVIARGSSHGSSFCQSSNSIESFHSRPRTGQAADRERRWTTFDGNYNRIQRTSKFLFQVPKKQCVTSTNIILFIVWHFLTQWRSDACCLRIGWAGDLNIFIKQVISWKLIRRFGKIPLLIVVIHDRASSCPSCFEALTMLLHSIFLINKGAGRKWGFLSVKNV